MEEIHARQDTGPTGWTKREYLCDNVLWRGTVPRGEDDPVFPGWPDAIREHNRLVVSDPGFVSHLDPTRDGVIVALRIS